MIKRLTHIIYIACMFPVMAFGQINTERVMTIGRNALYFEDYVLSIQYFNQAINAKPYLAEPYFYRGLAKMNLRLEVFCAYTKITSRVPYAIMRRLLPSILKM